MKVCLVFPPPEKGMNGPWLNPYLPYGLFTLAAYLERQGHELSVIDCMVEGLSHSRLKERIYYFKPEVLGVTLLSSVHDSGYKCLKIAKEIDGKILTVLGGAHASALDRELLQHWPEADVIVRKEGEISMANLLSDPGGMAAIKGVTYRDGEKIIRNEDEKPVDNLDSLPFPALHLAKMEKYFRMADRYEFHLRSPSSSLMTSRGCIGKCTYCASPFLWPKLRINSPEYVIENIKYQQRGYGIRDFKFFDDYFPVSMGWMRKFHKKVKDQQIDISYRCMGRADLVNDELLAMMKETGCYYIDFGIESGSQKILDSVNKKVAIDQVKKAIQLAEKHKIRRGGFFMVGFKGETAEDLSATLKLACSLPFDRACFSQTRVYPGTRIYEDNKIGPSFWFDGEELKDVYNAPVYRPKEYSALDLENIIRFFTFSARKKHFWRNLSLFFKMRRKRPKFVIFMALLKQLIGSVFSFDRVRLKDLAIR